MHEALLAINSNASAPMLRLDCYRNQQVLRRRAARPPQLRLRMTSSLGAAVFALALLPAPAAMAGPPATIKKAMLSFYWVIDETAPAYRGRADVALRDARGHVIATT